MPPPWEVKVERNQSVEARHTRPLVGAGRASNQGTTLPHQHVTVLWVYRQDQEDNWEVTLTALLALAASCT